MNHLNMYVIRRKADGLFAGNKKPWTNSLVHARVFKNKSGAKTSRVWQNFRTVPTEDQCETCKQSKYPRWDHVWEQDTPRSRYSAKQSVETIDQWSVRNNNRKPCYRRYRMSDAENPLKLVTVQVTIT